MSLEMTLELSQEQAEQVRDLLDRNSPYPDAGRDEELFCQEVEQGSLLAEFRIYNSPGGPYGEVVLYEPAKEEGWQEVGFSDPLYDFPESVGFNHPDCRVHLKEGGQA